VFNISVRRFSSAVRFSRFSGCFHCSERQPVKVCFVVSGKGASLKSSLAGVLF
jgi:hypothetical protein